MSVATRKAFYDKIEKMRKRPLIVYVTSRRPNAGGNMKSDNIPELCDQIQKLPQDAKEVDILIVSNGGDPMVSWRMISMLRERVEKISVLVPSCAYSAATLLALGADEIVMHPCGNLGPIDPQIDVQRKHPDGSFSQQRFGTEDLTSFLDFAKIEVGITDQSCLLEAFKMFASEVGATTIGGAARSVGLSQKLGVKLLRTHMKKDELADARRIVDVLNKEFFNHGYPVSRNEAIELGLKIAKPDPSLEQVIWDAWTEIEKDFKMRIPFSPIDKFVLVAKTKLGNPANDSSTTIRAMIESTRLNRMFVDEHETIGIVQPTGIIQANVINKAGCWKDSIDEAS